MKKQLFILLTLFLIIGCASWNLNTATRLGIIMATQEAGIEFRKNNKKLADEAIIYLDALEKFEANEIKYISILEAGINFALEKMDTKHKERMEPFIKQILIDIGANSFFSDSGVIKISKNIDMATLQAAVRGFNSGLKIE